MTRWRDLTWPWETLGFLSLGLWGWALVLAGKPLWIVPAWGLGGWVLMLACIAVGGYRLALLVLWLGPILLLVFL